LPATYEVFYLQAAVGLKVVVVLVVAVVVAVAAAGSAKVNFNYSWTAVLLMNAWPTAHLPAQPSHLATCLLSHPPTCCDFYLPEFALLKLFVNLRVWRSI